MDAPFAVIFDMDGVLFDTEAIALRCWGEAAKTLRLDGWKELYPQCIGITQPKTKALWVEHWGEENAAAFGKEILAVYDREYAGRPVPQKPGAAEILKALDEKGIPLAVASSTPEARVRQHLGEHGFLPRFDAVIGGDRLERSKPAPDIFLLASEALGAEPARCFVIEDSFNGIRAAHAAQMRPIMVPDLLPPTAEIAGMAEIVAADLFEAMEYLKKA
jgi:HAD superfamily hydrolase (TIGR01509 family)